MAVPQGISRYPAFAISYNTYFTETLASNTTENLAAIQYGLYIGQPLLTIVSITGLLVALIGAAVIISRGGK